MRIAHLILTHADPLLLDRMVGRLAHSAADVYIHVDKKSDITPFLYIGDRPNVYFIQKRVKVYWGAYAIVQATLNGFAEILQSGKSYDFVNLLSGQDYPIQPIEHFHLHLAKNKGLAFMEFYPIFNHWTEAIPRILEYHLDNFPMPGGYRLEKWLTRILPPRKLPYNMEPVGRSQWMTLPFEQVIYVYDYLKKHLSVRNFFMFTWAPDEFIFQTLLFNSPFKTQLINNNLRYIEWPEGAASPRTLTLIDFNDLVESGKFFARKVNRNESAALLDHLDYLQSQPGNAESPQLNEN
jgi:hypothetical protein